MKTPLSSTSRFSVLRGWLFVFAPLLCALGALPFGALHLRHLDPDNQVRQRQIAIKNMALQRTTGRERLLVCGDSSVAFSMDPEVLAKATGLPTVNLGYSAGTGALTLLGVASRAAAPGDTLVLSVLPGLFSGRVAPSPEGRLLAMMYGDPSMAVGGQPPLVPLTLLERLRTRLAACSPSERLIINDLTRKAVGMKGFRYSNLQIDAGGYFRGKIMMAHGCAETHVQPLAPEWQQILRTFVTRMHTQKVRVFYTIPWIETPDGARVRTQAGVHDWLKDLNPIMEVLPDPYDGLVEDHALFADTGVHMTVAGARERSRVLGQALNAAADQQRNQTSSSR